MKSKKDLLELETLIGALEYTGVPYADLVLEAKDNGTVRRFATPFLMDIYKKNNETMNRLKKEWQ